MQEQMENQDEIQIDLVELMHVLLRKIWIIILCTVVGATIMGSYTKFLVTPQYSASSIIYIMSKSATVSSVNLSLNAQLATDFMILAKSRPVIENVKEELGLNMSYEQIVQSVNIENPDGSQILKITATNPNPKLARDISNAMSDSVANRIAEVMDVDKPNIMEEAITPKHPSSPNLMKNIMLGGLLGAVLSIGVILLLYIVDDTIKNEEDVKKYLGLNTLAAFPEEGKQRRKNIA